MPDFNYNIDDFSDTSRLASKTSSAFYPSGEPLKTSYSVSGDTNRSLTQRDLQSVLSR